MIESLLGTAVADELRQDVIAMVRQSVNEAMPKQTNKQSDRVLTGYLNQTKAAKYVGSKALLAELETEGLGRYRIKGTIRYKITDLDEFMEMFRE